MHSEFSLIDAMLKNLQSKNFALSSLKAEVDACIGGSNDDAAGSLVDRPHAVPILPLWLRYLEKHSWFSFLCKVENLRHELQQLSPEIADIMSNLLVTHLQRAFYEEGQSTNFDGNFSLSTALCEKVHALCLKNLQLDMQSDTWRHWEEAKADVNFDLHKSMSRRASVDMFQVQERSYLSDIHSAWLDSCSKLPLQPSSAPTRTCGTLLSLLQLLASLCKILRKTNLLGKETESTLASAFFNLIEDTERSIVCALFPLAAHSHGLSYENNPLNPLFKLNNPLDLYGLPYKILAVSSFVYLESTISKFVEFYRPSPSLFSYHSHHISSLKLLDEVCADLLGKMLNLMKLKEHLRMSEWTKNTLEPHQFLHSCLSIPLRLLSSRLTSEFFPRKPSSLHYEYFLVYVWNYFSNEILETFVDGISKLPKCSLDGRDQMLIDYKEILCILSSVSNLRYCFALSLSDLNLVLSCRSNFMLEFKVENYIKAYYLDTCQFKNWLLLHQVPFV